MKRKKTKRKRHFNGKEGLSDYRAGCERIHKSTEDQITNTSEAPVELAGASLIKSDCNSFPPDAQRVALFVHCFDRV